MPNENFSHMGFIFYLFLALDFGLAHYGSEPSKSWLASSVTVVTRAKMHDVPHSSSCRTPWGRMLRPVDSLGSNLELINLLAEKTVDGMSREVYVPVLNVSTSMHHSKVVSLHSITVHVASDSITWSSWRFPVNPAVP